MNTSSTQDAVPSGCVEPRELDILVGKSTQARRHKGSRLFALYAASYTDRYREATNKSKRGEITHEMYSTITQASHRFLRFDESVNGWKEVSPTEARDKITHAIKYTLKKQDRKQKSNVPLRSNSDSSRRSESSNLSGASSLDLEQLYSTQQKQLGKSLNLSQMSSFLRARRMSHRSSTSIGSGASNLSREDSGRLLGHARLNVQNKSVSFSSTETGRTVTTVATATTVESEPLPVDLSSIQHFDMSTSINRDIFDRTPIPPSRPTYDDEANIAPEESRNVHQSPTEIEPFFLGHEDISLLNGGEATVGCKNNPTSSFMSAPSSNANDIDVLDPLLEVDNDGSSSGSSSNTTPPHRNTGVASQIKLALENTENDEYKVAESLQRLELSDYPAACAYCPDDPMGHEGCTPSVNDGMLSMELLPLEPASVDADDEFCLLPLDLEPSSINSTEEEQQVTSESWCQDVALSLMQDPVMEWDGV